MEPRFAICVGAYDSPKLAPRPGRGVQPTTCRLRSIQRRLDRQVLNAPTVYFIERSAFDNLLTLLASESMNAFGAENDSELMTRRFARGRERAHT